jgi:hypothetical protein
MVYLASPPVHSPRVGERQIFGPLSAYVCSIDIDLYGIEDYQCDHKFVPLGKWDT